MSKIIYVGAKFCSTEEFNQQLKRFEDETCCSFVLKNSTKSVTDNKKRKRPMPAEKFDLARGTVVCAHYGRKRANPSKGIKTCTKSQKLQCGASFSFKYDDFEQCLVVTKCELQHNHLTDSRLYAQQHKQKKFSEQQEAVLKEIVALNPDNEKLLVMVQRDFQKSLCLKDIRMLKSKLNGESKGSDVAAVSKHLKAIEDLGGSFRLALSTAGQETERPQQHLIDMVAFSTKGMLACFRSFPECIFIDGTYKKNNSGYPLYQVMVQDCLGTARPVFYAFIRCETIPILTMVLQAFADFVGEDLKKSRVVMSDKCSSEAIAIRTVLPWARHLLCHWHVYAAMEKKLKSLGGERKLKQTLSHLHMKLKDTPNPLEFLAVEKKIEELSTEFYSYYCQQWRGCKEQWAACERLTIANFLNDTNNFVESENLRLGKILSSTKSIASAVYHLHRHGIVRINELSQSLAKESISNTSYPNAKQDILHIYSLFSPYAAKAMIKNHESVHNLLVASTDNQTFIVTETTGARFKVTINENMASCHCPFAVQMTLPCVHAMACHLSGMDAQLYSESNRWLRGRGHVAATAQQVGSAVVRECIPAERRHYQTEALVVMLSNILKSSGGRQFQKRQTVIKTILALWEDGKEVTVGVADDEDAFVSGNEDVQEHVVDEDYVVIDKDCDSSIEGVDAGVAFHRVEEYAVVDGGNIEVDADHSVEEDAIVDCCSIQGEDADTAVQRVEEDAVVGSGGIQKGTDAAVHGVEEDLIDDGSIEGEHADTVVHRIEEDAVVDDADGDIDEGGGGGVVVRRGRKRHAEMSLDDALKLNIIIPSIRTRGRPAKPKTKKRKGKAARNVQINESICHICLSAELEKEKSDNSGYDTWTRCSLCVRWFHDICIGEIETVERETTYICKHH